MEENEMNKTEQIRECFLAKARQHLLAGSLPESASSRNPGTQHVNTCCAFAQNSNGSPPQS